MKASARIPAIPPDPTRGHDLGLQHQSRRLGIGMMSVPEGVRGASRRTRDPRHRDEHETGLKACLDLLHAAEREETAMTPTLGPRRHANDERTPTRARRLVAARTGSGHRTPSPALRHQGEADLTRDLSRLRAAMVKRLLETGLYQTVPLRDGRGLEATATLPARARTLVRPLARQILVRLMRWRGSAGGTRVVQKCRDRGHHRPRSASVVVETRAK